MFDHRRWEDVCRLDEAGAFDAGALCRQSARGEASPIDDYLDSVRALVVLAGHAMATPPTAAPANFGGMVGRLLVLGIVSEVDAISEAYLGVSLMSVPYRGGD